MAPPTSPVATREPAGGQREAGFSLVELIIAIFLIAVLALALLPLLIGATRASTTNESLVAANAFADAQLAPLRAGFPNESTTSSCTTLLTYARTGIADPSGTDLRADVVVDDCPPDEPLPAAVRVTITVYSATSPDRNLVELPTQILISVP